MSSGSSFGVQWCAVNTQGTFVTHLYINSQQAQNKYCKWRSKIEARIKDVTNVMFNINNKKAVQMSGGRKGLEQIIDKVKLQEEGCFQVLVILCVCLCPLLLLLEL